MAKTRPRPVLYFKQRASSWKLETFEKLSSSLASGLWWPVEAYVARPSLDVVETRGRSAMEGS
jgi:hypothetical protein